MSRDLASLLREKGLSNDAVGQQVHDRWKRREPKKRSLPAARSIGAKLGELLRGNPTWWKNHPHALASLADLLGVAPEALVDAAIPAEARTIPFPHFDELPPLSPEEEPCALDEHGWLRTRAFAALGQGVHVWFVAPPGAGKTLTVEYLRKRHASAVMAFTARHLIEITRQMDPAMQLVAEVEHVDPATDLGAIRELTRRQVNTCILSPFAKPSLLQAEEKRWFEPEFFVQQGWRERLIRWAHGRLPERSRLDVPKLLDWLEDVDPKSELFATPGELLPIVAFCYRHERAPTNKDKLEMLADEYFGRLFDAAAQRHPFLRRGGRRIADALVKRRLLSIDVPNAALPRNTWLALLPTDATPNATADDVRRQVEAAARERKADARAKKVEELVSALTAGRAEEALDCIIDQGVLRTRKNGRLDIHPVWARRGLERRALNEAIRANDGARWGLLAADETRRLAVDTMLDELPPPALVDVARKSVDGSTSDLGTAGAIEALFSAFARRMLDGWTPQDVHVPVLQRLGGRQIELLRRAVGVEIAQHTLPLTRVGAYSDTSLFTFEAWTFSMKVPPPVEVEPRLRWLLPGWTEHLELAQAPKHLYSPRMHEEKGPRVEKHAERLAAISSLSREVLKRCRDDDTPAEVPEVLLVWLVVDGLPSGGKTRPEHLGEIARGISGLLPKTLHEEPLEIQQRLMLTLWPHVKAQHGGHPFWSLLRQRERDPDLFAMLTRQLPHELLVKEILDAKFDDGEVRKLDDLPVDLQRAILRALAERAAGLGGGMHGLEDLIRTLELADIDLLVQFAANQYALGGAAVGRVFALDPMRALTEAQVAIEQNDSTAWRWFYAAPRGYWGALLGLIEEHGVERLHWAARWLTRHLAQAGGEAPRMFRLLDVATTVSLRG